MKRSIVSIIVFSILISILMQGNVFAATQAEIDAVTGPAFAIEKAEAKEEKPVPALRGELIGNFKTTGYCNCKKCSNGHKLTATGTVPQAKRTVSADWKILPAGTKIMIGDSDIIYVVEDSGVKGNVVDVYYDTHDVAWSHGVQYFDIYKVNEEALPKQ